MDAPVQPAGSWDVGVDLVSWNWNSIGAECEDTLGPAGVARLFTSAPQDHSPGPEWWRAYEPGSHQLESRFGDRAEFSGMVARCTAAEVDVVVDVALGPMTVASEPGAGDASDAADLAPSSDAVETTLVAYLSQLLTLGVSGFRVNSDAYLGPDDIAGIFDDVAGDPYVLQVVDGPGGSVGPERYVGNGQVTGPAFARALSAHVRAGALRGLENLGADVAGVPSTSAAVYVTNAVTERSGETLSYRDGGAYTLASVALLASSYGTPVLYSGHAFVDPTDGPPLDDSGLVRDTICAADLSAARAGEWACAHRDPAIAGMLGFRSAVGADAATGVTSDDGFIAYSRGSRGFVALNADSEPYAGTVATRLPEGAYCDVVGGGIDEEDPSACTGPTLRVTGAGEVAVNVPANGAVAIHVGSRLGRLVCGPVGSRTDRCVPSTGSGLREAQGAYAPRARRDP
jgi:alpha-amylase